MILAINTAILVVLFAFAAWLYQSSESEVERQVVSSMERVSAMTARLARLRERELSTRAQSFTVSPLLRSAVITRDAETIEDVLASFARKNSLASAVLVQDAKVVYANNPQHREARADDVLKGMFRGRALLGRTGGGLTLVLGERPSPSLLDEWSEITLVRYGFRSPPSALAINNIMAGDATIRSKENLPERPIVVSSPQNTFYARTTQILDGRFVLGIYDRYEPYWAGFQAQRNSLVVLGTSLFFVGLLMSFGFAYLIERYALSDASQARSSSEWKEMLEEIEQVREKLLNDPARGG
ncbi:MAG: hypothetical protein V3T60_03430 [Candidatus Binatia bacterium]